MSTIPHKVGTNLELAFQYPNNTTTMTTGKVSSDFALKIAKNGTGNQATTGCTFSEIDATNNPGMYIYTCSGSTSFVSATGQYQIEVYDTADFTKVWAGTIFVTSDGTGAGSWGDATFTATASDGRVYDGAAAVEGATIYIANSAGDLYVKTVSNSSGLYGPIYFNTDGTYTVYAQLTGYTVASGTITVSGGTATGPGTDLTITQSSLASSLLVSTLQGYTRRQMEDRTGSAADTIILEVINEAVELISMEREWPYYHHYGTIALQPAYSTGTVALNNGSKTVTLTSGTWPAWAASGQLFVNNSWINISTRTSDSVIVLADEWGGEDLTAASYTLGQIRYTLPSDCVRLSTFMQGIDWPWDTHTSAAYIEAVKDRWTLTNNNSTYWAIEKNYLVVWPIPQSVRHINLLYYRKPAEVTSGSDTLDWDASQVVLLRRAIDYVVAGRRGADTEEKRAAKKVAREEYEAALSKAWSWDKTAADPNASDNGSFYAYGDYLRGQVDL